MIWLRGLWVDQADPLLSLALTETSMTSCNPAWLNLLCVQTCLFAFKLSIHWGRVCVCVCVCRQECINASLLLIRRGQLVCVCGVKRRGALTARGRWAESHRSHPPSRCCVLLARLCPRVRVCALAMHYTVTCTQLQSACCSDPRSEHEVCSRGINDATKGDFWNARLHSKNYKFKG